jgi:hypothetical protein
MLTRSESSTAPSGAVTAPADRRTPFAHTEDPMIAPEVLALFAEVDAILCEADERVNLLRRRPAPPVTGCALIGPRSAGRTWSESVTGWGTPPRLVRAVQRSPPAEVNLQSAASKEVMSSR